LLVIGGASPSATPIARLQSKHPYATPAHPNFVSFFYSLLPRGLLSQQATPLRSAFSLRPYMDSSNLRGAWQVLNTLGPVVLLWALVPVAARTSWWLLVPLVVLMVLFSSRCFSLMHDCGHGSLFRSPKLNRATGFLFGVINAIPQYPWSRGHDYHHRHNGNWELYRGPSALITTDQFLELSPRGQWFYELLRQPLMLIPGGFFYLVIKPRLALVLGVIDKLRTGRTRHWYTQGEFWDLLGNNICVLALWFAMGRWLGLGLFWSVYSIVMACSAAIFICIFFVQHNYEGSYAHGTEGWNSIKGSLEGSSYLKLPALLNWFSADIAYHSIHHLSARIPNYRLREAHERNAHLLDGVHTLSLGQIPGCFQFILWNPSLKRLQSIALTRREALEAAVASGRTTDLHKSGQKEAAAPV